MVQIMLQPVWEAVGTPVSRTTCRARRGLAKLDFLADYDFSTVANGLRHWNNDYFRHAQNIFHALVNLTGGG